MGASLRSYAQLICATRRLRSGEIRASGGLGGGSGGGEGTGVPGVGELGGDGGGGVSTGGDGDGGGFGFAGGGQGVQSIYMPPWSVHTR